MIGVLVFNALMILLGLAVASPLVPVNLVGDALVYLHTTIGITTPPREKVRMFALIWIASLLVIVDGLLFLLVFITSQLH